MGVEFAHLIIPRDNRVRPQPTRIAALAEAWLAERYIPAPGSKAHQAAQSATNGELASRRLWGVSMETGRGDFVEVDGPVPGREIQRLEHDEYLLRWSCVLPTQNGLACPLNIVPGPNAYYEMQLLAAEDFVHYCDERLDALDITCSCGESLAYWHDADSFDAERIRRLCPSCGQEFRPQDQAVDSRHPFTGEVSRLQGGACFRFAIRIDAGKGLNPVPKVNGDPPRAAPAFLSLCERVLGTELYEVGYFY